MRPVLWACQSLEPRRLLAVGVMPALPGWCLCVQQPVNAGEDADGSSPRKQGLACDELASPRGEGAGSHRGIAISMFPAHDPIPGALGRHGSATFRLGEWVGRAEGASGPGWGSRGLGWEARGWENSRSTEEGCEG